VTAWEIWSLGTNANTNLTLNNANVASSQTLTLSATNVTTAGFLVKIDASNEADGVISLSVAGSALDTAGGSAAILIGGSGNDTMVLNASGALTLDATELGGISAFETWTLGSNQAYALTLADGNNGSGALTINGAAATSNALVINGSADTNGTLAITGGSVGDTITGGAGADTLTGGGGNDILDGGSGADTFVFAATAEANGTDTITNYIRGTDKIDLKAFETVGALVNLSGATDALAAGEVFYLFSQSAGAADSVAGVITAVNAAGGTLTDTAATSWLVISDNNSTAVYEWTGNAGGNEATGDTLTLAATLDDVMTAAGDIVIS